MYEVPFRRTGHILRTLMKLWERLGNPSYFNIFVSRLIFYIISNYVTENYKTYPNYGYMGNNLLFFGKALFDITVVAG